MLLKRFVIYLFVLMQGIAPLLHAHTGKTGHSGVHLPLLACASGEARGDTGTQVVNASPRGYTIGVPTSLESRQAPQSVDDPTHAPAPWMAVRDNPGAGIFNPIPDFAPKPSPHLRPPPTAPPLA
jgi:hypothetical protein